MRSLLFGVVFVVALIVLDVSLSGGFYTTKAIDMSEQIARSFMR